MSRQLKIEILSVGGAAVPIKCVIDFAEGDQLVVILRNPATGKKTCAVFDEGTLFPDKPRPMSKERKDVH